MTGKGGYVYATFTLVSFIIHMYAATPAEADDNLTGIGPCLTCLSVVA